MNLYHHRFAVFVDLTCFFDISYLYEIIVPRFLHSTEWICEIPWGNTISKVFDIYTIYKVFEEKGMGSAWLKWAAPKGCVFSFVVSNWDLEERTCFLLQFLSLWNHSTIDFFIRPYEFVKYFKETWYRINYLKINVSFRTLPFDLCL